MDELGARLTSSDSPADDDVSLLNDIMRAYQTVLDTVKAELTSLNLEPTTRVKTRDILIGKLRRQRTIRLSQVQDLAGARIVLQGNRNDQDDVVRRIVDHFTPRCDRPPAVYDRRADLSHG